VTIGATHSDDASAEHERADEKLATSEWMDVIAVDELEPKDVTQVRVRGRTVALYDADDGNVYATSAMCSHAGAALADGYFDGWVIECPLHQGCFDIRDGQPKGAPATRRLQIYAVRVVNGRIEIRLPSRVADR
jgi:naphthalene 1,2-dioxygenase system ferredoxin subunit